MEEARELNRTVEALFNAKSETLLQAVGPFVFTFSEYPAFDDFFFNKGWGDHWGVIVYAEAELKAVAAHFRRFLKVKTEDGVQLYFRFYDPRVLRIFLPTCDAQQLRDVFGPVRHFLMEDADRAYALKFWLQNGVLTSLRIPFEELASAHSGSSAVIPRQADPPSMHVHQQHRPRRRFSIFEDEDADALFAKPRATATAMASTGPASSTSQPEGTAGDPNRARSPTAQPKPPRKPKWDMFS
jgi:hypothetical protein